MTVVAGIDEAGYGPVLGPLVCACCAFTVPDATAADNLWRRLAPTVVRRPAEARPTRLAVDDSKVLYAGGRGLLHLERGVLALLESTPPRVADLLHLLCENGPARAGRWPWYGDLDLPLPATSTPDPLERLRSCLRGRMSRAGVSPCLVAAEPLFAAELNQLVTGGASKADAAWSRVERLIWRLLDAAPPGRVVLHMDRQGGRTHYREMLQRSLPQGLVWIVAESREASHYLVELGVHTLELHVEIGGDRRQLPVAWAAMTAKYLREMLMAHLNRFWLGAIPGLRPTAGYPLDGRRFAAAVAASLPALGLATQDLVRCR